MSTPIFYIGAGGHQNLGDETTIQFVSRQIRHLLTSYQQEKQSVIVRAMLAPGADQLFVRSALELGIPVEAVLPCKEYETIFTTDQARENYHHLLQACRSFCQLPPQACTDDAYLAAEQWMIDHSDIVFLLWNGLPSKGKGGTADMAQYARSQRRPFIHLDIRKHQVKTYGEPLSQSNSIPPASPKRSFVTEKHTVYHGPVLTVNQYRLRMPGGEEVVRDIVERPESVLILPISQGIDETMTLLIEEYNLGAGVWQLTLPGGKIEADSEEKIYEQAQRELRQETGYQARRFEKLLEFHSHPGYISHKVHLLIAHELEWNPLESERHEEIHAQTYPLSEALAATAVDYRCDPEAALALLLYAQKERGM